MISTGFPERSNTLSPSLYIYIYISTLSDEEGKKERRKEIGIEQFENARHDRGGVPMSRMESEPGTSAGRRVRNQPVSRLFSNDSIRMCFLPPKSGELRWVVAGQAKRRRGLKRGWKQIGRNSATLLSPLSPPRVGGFRERRTERG